MYGVKHLPENLLKDSLLLQVCFGENEVIFRFDEDEFVTVAVEIGASTNKFQFLNLKHVSNFLVSLVGSRVSFIRDIGADTIEFGFSNGLTFRVMETLEPYESVVFSLRNTTIVI